MWILQASNSLDVSETEIAPEILEEEETFIDLLKATRPDFELKRPYKNEEPPKDNFSKKEINIEDLLTIASKNEVPETYSSLLREMIALSTFDTFFELSENLLETKSSDDRFCIISSFLATKKEEFKNKSSISFLKDPLFQKEISNTIEKFFRKKPQNFLHAELIYKISLIMQPHRKVFLSYVDKKMLSCAIFREIVLQNVPLLKEAKDLNTYIKTVKKSNFLLYYVFKKGLHFHEGIVEDFFISRTDIGYFERFLKRIWELKEELLKYAEEKHIFFFEDLFFHLPLNLSSSEIDLKIDTYGILLLNSSLNQKKVFELFVRSHRKWSESTLLARIFQNYDVVEEKLQDIKKHEAFPKDISIFEQNLRDICTEGFRHKKFIEELLNSKFKDRDINVYFYSYKFTPESYLYKKDGLDIICHVLIKLLLQSKVEFWQMSTNDIFKAISELEVRIKVEGFYIKPIRLVEFCRTERSRKLIKEILEKLIVYCSSATETFFLNAATFSEIEE